MERLIRRFTTATFVISLYTVFAGAWPQSTTSQPSLFFREGWNGRKVEGVAPLNQDSVENPNLILRLYGPGTYSPNRDSETTLNVNIRKLGDEGSSIVWSGMAEGNWAVTLRHKDNYVDLSGPQAKIRWRAFQEGISQVLHPLLKLADGTYVLGVQGAGPTEDYETTEMVMSKMNWVEFDPMRVLDKVPIKPNLSRVDEIGFTTLTRGGGHGKGVAAHVDWIEVYGVPVPKK